MKEVNAAIITIGDELLIGQTIDTNSAFIAQELNKIGIWVKRRVAIGDVKEEILSDKIDYGSAEQYWQFMTDVVAPVVNALSKTDESTRQKIKNEVFEACNKMLTNRNLIIEYSAIIISAEK